VGAMMATTAKLMTAEELLALPDDGQRHELIDGMLIAMPPPGDEHGGLEAMLAASLTTYVVPRKLGVVRTGETGFLLRRNPDLVRAADVAFIRQERFEAMRKVTGYRTEAPDLAAEVVSPSDRYSDVLEKVATWLEHGTRMVIVIDPRRRLVAVYRSLTEVRHLTFEDTIDGEDVVPGWQLAVRDLFAMVE
jgi:Uma2 family endonuclease